MSDKSHIEWTDATWNPVRGCTKVSAGCDHCYAETFAERFRGVPGHPYEQGFDPRLAPDKLEEPLKWKKPRRVFVNSMSDLFHSAFPREYIAQVFAVMALTPQHTYQVLTKRPGRMQLLLCDPAFGTLMGEAIAELGERNHAHALSVAGVPWPLPNVWLGVSVEDQDAADKRIPPLLNTPAAVRFLSCEPLLGPVDLRCAACRGTGLYRGIVRYDGRLCASCHNGMAPLDWVIVGGESGSGARTMDLTWARSLVDQCEDVGIAVFVKQLGSKPMDWHDAWHGGLELHPYPLRDRKGGDWGEWPEYLRVREFPAASVTVSA